MNILSICLRTLAFALALAAAGGPAHAANYTFPGTLPAGCAGTGPTYTCGALTFGNTDVITIAAPTPATITVNGNLQVNRARINQAGLASDLTITVNGTLGTGTNAVVNASVSATGNITFGNGTTIGGALNGSGTVALGNNSTVSGALTGNSTINFGTGSSAPQCVRSVNSSTITLGNNAVAGSVCCGAPGTCSSACVTNNSGNTMPGICGGGIDPAIAGRFNAFEVATAAGSISGVIKTKVAGTAFTVAVAAINTAGTALATAFAGTVKVEVLDASNNTGPLDSTTGCRSSWTVATGTSAANLVFATTDQGRKTSANLTIANSWKDTRLRISYPATGAATAVGCSNDNFAIRPHQFTTINASTPYAGDVNAQTTDDTGPYRNLSNVNATGGLVHKAGTPFTLRARAVNSASVTTTNYSGTPQADRVTCAPTCPAVVGLGVLSPPVWTSISSGVLKGTATYNEAGAFGLLLKDETFAAVDAADGSTDAERFILSAPGNVGRFVPHHFDLAVLVAPTFWTFTDSATCLSTRTFTYLGQTLKYQISPQATVIARSLGGTTTRNYPDAKLLALQRGNPQYGVTTTTPGVVPAIPPSNKPPTVSTANGDGTAVLQHDPTETVSIDRATTTPMPAPPFDADITLAWSVSDTSEGTGVNIISSTPFSFPAIAFDQTKTFRFGTLLLPGGNGSELMRMALPVTLQFWNGSGWETNIADSCTVLPTTALAMGNFRGNLAACETAPVAPTASSITFSAGRALLALQAPGIGNSGSVDLTLNLGLTGTGQRCNTVGAAATAVIQASQPWLQRRSPTGTSYTVDPTARASFGQYRSPVIHMREVF